MPARARWSKRQPASPIRNIHRLGTPTALRRAKDGGRQQPDVCGARAAPRQSQGVVVDPIIGELKPGVEVAVSEPLLAVRPTDETRQAVDVRLEGLGSAQLEIQQ